MIKCYFKTFFVYVYRPPPLSNGQEEIIPSLGRRGGRRPGWSRKQLQPIVPSTTSPFDKLRVLLLAKEEMNSASKNPLLLSEEGVFQFLDFTGSSY
jgi:hypothetical protein